MAPKTRILSEELESSPLRQIQSRTNSPVNIPTKYIRRVCSFTLNSNSSEEFPSPHGSIYEAVYISTSNNEENGHKIELVNIPTRKNCAVPGGKAHNENIRDGQSALDIDTVDIAFLYGHGTVLDTITEQRSYATMRTLARKISADNVPDFRFVRHEDSFALSKTPRRKLSFSLDDLSSVNFSYHEACAMIERETRKPLPVHEIYARPKSPLNAPLKRPGTPEGMPSWTAAQRRPASRTRHQQAATQNCLQRWFGISASESPLLSRLSQPDSHTPDRIVFTPTRSPLAPRFRPPRSAYGPLNQHPFVNPHAARVNSNTRAPVVPTIASAGPSCFTGNSRSDNPTGKEKLQRVRFTPSATARDSEAILLQPTIGTSTTTFQNVTAKKSLSRREERSRNQRCPHLKGRRSFVEASHDGLVECGENCTMLQSGPSHRRSLHQLSTTPLPARLNSRTSSRGSLVPPGSGENGQQRNRSMSISSDTHLIAGAAMLAIDDPVQTISVGADIQGKDINCWKCRLERSFSKVDRFWIRTVGCMYFVCCGFDVDEAHGGSTSLHEFSGAGSGFSRSSSVEGGMAPRRVILQQSPVMTL